jgi:hypothetical protein
MRTFKVWLWITMAVTVCGIAAAEPPPISGIGPFIPDAAEESGANGVTLLERWCLTEVLEYDTKTAALTYPDDAIRRWVMEHNSPSVWTVPKYEFDLLVARLTVEMLMKCFEVVNWKVALGTVKKGAYQTWLEQERVRAKASPTVKQK